MALKIFTEAEIKEQVLYKWPRLCLDFDIWNIPKTASASRYGTWTEVKFEKANIPLLKSVSGQQGIYMFIAKPSNPSHINHGYILYVGETDDLESRFQSYFGYRTTSHPSDQLKRQMVILWEDYLYFNYVTTNYPSKKDREIEEYDLIDTLNPPVNDKFRSMVLKAKRKELKHLINL